MPVKYTARYTTVTTGELQFLWLPTEGHWYVLEDLKATGIWMFLPEESTFDEVSDAYNKNTKHKLVSIQEKI